MVRYREDIWLSLARKKMHWYSLFREASQLGVVTLEESSFRLSWLEIAVRGIKEAIKTHQVHVRLILKHYKDYEATGARIATFNI